LAISSVICPSLVKYVNMKNCRGCNFLKSFLPFHLKQMSTVNTELLFQACLRHISNILKCDFVELFLQSRIASKNRIKLTHIQDKFIKDK
jgi:hypothetical protein